MGELQVVGARRKSQAGREGEAGFTLIELLVVLAVIGLLIAAAPLIVSAARPGAEAKAAAFEIANDLRVARARAISENEEVSMVVDLDGKSYSVKPGRETRKLPHTLKMSIASSLSDGTPPRITFFPDGSSTGGDIRLVSTRLIHRIVAHPLTGRVSVDE